MEYKARPPLRVDALYFGLWFARCAFSSQGIFQKHPSSFRFQCNTLVSSELWTERCFSCLSVLLHPEGRESISAKRKIVRL